MRQLQAEAGAPLTAQSGRGSAADPVQDPARRARGARLALLLAAVAAVVYLLDRLTKVWAVGALTPGQPQDFVGGVVRLHLIFNPGAAFSLGTGLTPVFTAAQAGVSVAVVVLARRVGSRWWAVGMGLLLGGALGNLTDRLTRPPGVGVGHVVDFLQLPYWPIFNIADSAVVGAACLIAVAAMRGVPMSGRPAVALDHGRPGG